MGDLNVTLDEATELFLETKRWLWLCAYQAETGSSISVPLFSEMNAIDRCWHLFLLFTRDYAAFCERYFGFFIHHEPQTSQVRRQTQALLEADPVAFRASKEAELTLAYGIIYDVLGRDVLLRWTEEFPERFARLA